MEKPEKKIGKNQKILILSCRGPDKHVTALISCVNITCEQLVRHTRQSCCTLLRGRFHRQASAAGGSRSAAQEKQSTGTVPPLHWDIHTLCIIPKTSVRKVIERRGMSNALVRSILYHSADVSARQLTHRSMLSRCLSKGYACASSRGVSVATPASARSCLIGMIV